MSFRLPQSLSGGHRPQAGSNVLETEILQQKAESLGHMGHQVEKALARLRAFDAGQPAGDSAARRSALLDEAADRAWAFMIQRELCGLRHWEAVVKAYAIPREVLNRMGRVTR
jgi:hypothetical protein